MSGALVRIISGDARDIEQIVDQMRDLLDLALDDLQLSRQMGIRMHFVSWSEPG